MRVYIVHSAYEPNIGGVFFLLESAENALQYLIANEQWAPDSWVQEYEVKG